MVPCQRVEEPASLESIIFIKTPELETGKLNAAIGLLQNHHDGFRLRFRHARGGYVQSYEPETEERKAKLNILDIRGLESTSSINESLQKWQSGLDIENVAYVCSGLSSWI